MSIQSLLLRVSLIVSLLLSVATSARAQRIESDVLRTKGLTAYNRLPDYVKLANAREFAEAVRYLYAYEQRGYRGEVKVDAGAQTALDWLLSNLQNLKTGKADGIRSNEDLRDRGMSKYNDAMASVSGGRIWDVTAYVSSLANLFAYLQNIPNSDEVAAKAHDTLLASRLVVAGTKGDDPSESKRLHSSASALPTSRRPRIGKGAGAIVGAAAATGIVAGNVVSSSGDRSRSDTLRTSSAADSLRALSVRYDSALAELSTLREETARLRTTNQDILKEVAAIRTELTTRTVERDRRQARAVQLLDSGRLREARDAARAVLQTDSSVGDAHMVIARAYAGVSARDTTPEGRAVAWLAIDHLTLAMKMGAGDYATGQRMMKELSARAPTEADLTSRRWVPQQKLRINFPPYEWIDEETFVRSRP